jgi:hypothetical protein
VTPPISPRGSEAQLQSYSASERISAKDDKQQQTTKCFANLHMRPEEYALWDVTRSLSHKTGILYFDGRELAKLFDGTAKNRIYRAAKSLVKKGWYKVLSPARRDERTGWFSPARYRVLSPEEWSEEHPHACRSELQSSPDTETGSSPEIKTGQSRNRERPVPETGTTSPGTGTYSVKENSVEENTVQPTAERMDGRVSHSLSESFHRATGKTLTYSDAEKDSLAALKKKHGDPLVWKAWRLFLTRSGGFEELHHPISMFVREFQQHAVLVKGRGPFA